jgi:enoyl-CoA hydratase/carnithine racemase
MSSSISLNIDAGLATLTLTNPTLKNAMSGENIAELHDVLSALRRNDSVTALLLTGAGSDFCSGGNVNAMGGSIDSTTMHHRMQHNNRTLAALAEFDRPVVAAVDGVAFGAGFSLALAADFIIASERARFCMAFARIGLVPDLGATYSLPRIVGLQKAKELIYSAREVRAQEALSLGLVLEVHPAGAHRTRAEELARSLANMSSSAFGLTKRMLGHSYEGSLAMQLESEASAQAVAMTSVYVKEALARFARKEPPQYQWFDSTRSLEVVVR